MQIACKKTDSRAQIPKFMSEGAAGADICAVLDGEITIAPHQTALISTGLCMEIPEGYAGFLFARSGIALKKGLAPANKTGVIDSDYRGEVKIALHNHSEKDQIVQPNERIAQLVILPVVSADFVQKESLDETRRSGGGFGSTGSQ